MNKSISSKLSALKQLKGKWGLLLLMLSGILLLTLGGKSTPKESTVPTTPQEGDTYVRELEATLTELCRKVTGDNAVSVALTLASGEEYIYAEKGSGGYFSSSDGGLLTQTLPPKILGVAVVSTRGGDPVIQARVSALLSALLAIGSNRICVVQGFP